MKIPDIRVPQQQGHHELLSDQIADEDGNIKTIYKTHPHGNRKQRRAKQRHHPFFTKTRTGGRLWEIGVRDLQRERKKDGGSD